MQETDGFLGMSYEDTYKRYDIIKLTFIACSYMRSCDYFNEALEEPDAFLRKKCSSYKNYLNCSCEASEQFVLRGSLLGYKGLVIIVS